MTEGSIETPLALALSTLGFMMAVIWGGPLIRALRHFKIGKLIRVEEPGKHITKMGTPTMGGVMFILPVTLITVMLNSVSLIGVDVLGRSVLLPLLVMMSFAALGAMDDWEGIRGPRRGLGMRARTKFLFQVILATITAIGLRYVLDVPQLYWPTFKEPIDLGILYIPVAVIIIVGLSNAVNFTDGLDGLAGLIAATAFAAYGAIALMQGSAVYWAFLFHAGWRPVRIFMVQRPPGGAFHGRHGIAGTWRHAGSRQLDDRSVAAFTFDRHYSCQRSHQRYLAGRLLQTDTRQAHLQDGAGPPALRAAGLERDPGGAALLAGRAFICIFGHCPGTGVNE
jgi:hypothetical protein